MALCPAAAQAQGLDVVGTNDLGGGGLNGEVAVLGDTALVGSGILAAGGLRSSFHSSYPCPETTVKVVDLSTPSNPSVVSRIPVVKDAVASDVALLRVDTPQFSGVLGAVALVRCNFGGNFVERGVQYWDLTNPSDPGELGRYDADQNLELPEHPDCGPRPERDGFRCAASQDQVALVQRPDGRVLSLSTEPFSSASQGATYDPGPGPNADFHGDLRIVDVTDPENPVEVGSYPNGDQRFRGFNSPQTGPFPISGFGFSNNGCRPFDAGYGPAAFPDGNRALLSSFDLGLLTVDLANPAAPSLIGQWSYDRGNRALEGNAHTANFASVGGRSLALVGESDWIGPDTRVSIDGPASIAGSKFACEAIFSLFDPEDDAAIYRKPGGEVSGEIVYVGRGCPNDPVLGGDLTGKIAFRDRNAIPSRQTGLTGICQAADATKRLQDRGAKGVIVANTSTAIPQAISFDGAPPATGNINIPTVMIDTGDGNALRDVLCPATATPGGGCAPGQSVSGGMVDSPGKWGGLRVVDVSDPAAPALVGTYQSPRSEILPPDQGVYAVHHAVGRGNQGYVAAYADGLRVIDLSSPALTEIDAFVPPDRADPSGSRIPAKAHVTGVDAGPAGTIVISDMNSGLYVLRAPATAGGGVADPAPGPAAAPAPAGSSTPPTPVDLRPSIGSLRLTNSVFAVDPAGRVAQRRPPRGTSFRFTLSERASVRFTLQRRTTGRRVNGRCVRTTASNRRRTRCVRYVAVGRFTRSLRAGAVRVAFSGRLRVSGRARSLRPARYRATLVATDATGKRSLPKRVAFRVVRR